MRNISIPHLVILGTFALGILFLWFDVTILEPLVKAHTAPANKADGFWIVATVASISSAAGTGLVGTAILFVFIQTSWVQQEIESYFTQAFSNPEYVEGLTKEHKGKILDCLLTSYDVTHQSGNFLRGCTLSIPKFVGGAIVRAYYFDIVIDINGPRSIHTSRRSMEICNAKAESISVLDLINSATPRHVFLNSGEKRTLKSINLTFEDKNIIIEDDEIPATIVVEEKCSPEAGYQRCWVIDWSVLKDKHPWIVSEKVQSGGSVSISFTDVTDEGSHFIGFRLRFLTEGIRVSARLINSDGKNRRIEGLLFGNELIGKMVERHFDNDVLTLSSRRKWLIPGSGFIFFPVEIPSIPLKSSSTSDDRVAKLEVIAAEVALKSNGASTQEHADRT